MYGQCMAAIRQGVTELANAWQLKAVVLAAAVLVWWLDVGEYEDSMSVVISWRKFK